ncbi:minichromosome maintenance (MCM) complex subunit [Perkinsela sp. CCAP 1560/4]|nr:minichromosome maintenance (MCM) complex subunit [Perkinsela sp. CCAP 1560/4]|eukprot:KNH01725.1 minichromosome maintenance (MCM) complex subunit [Perkinsela sp. CCAP 1560/4]
MQTDIGRVSTATPSVIESNPHANEQGFITDTLLPAGSDAPESTAESNFAADRESLKSKFIDFISSFRSSTDSMDLTYKRQLQDNLYGGRHFLEVKWEDATCFSQDLGQSLRTRATQTIVLFEEALREIAVANHYFTDTQVVNTDVQLQIVWSTNLTTLREIGSESISHLISVPGLVIKVSKTRLRCAKAIIQCQSCQTQISFPVTKDLELPRKCLSNQTPVPGTPSCRPNPYTLLSQSCEYEDQQIIKLQELPNDVPAGEMPRSVNVLVDRFLTDCVVPGDKVIAVAVNMVIDSRKSSGRSAVGLRSQFLRCVGLMSYVYASDPSDDQCEGDRRSMAGGSIQHHIHRPNSTLRVPIWETREEKIFQEMAKRPNIYEEIAESIDPAVFGSLDIKKAIACLLFGGTRKKAADGTILRGDMNVLLMGDPSTAKSQLLKYVEKVAPFALYTSGKGGSAAGLTAAVVPGENGEWWLEAGSLVLADGGVLCIDEFDKMRLQDQVAIHEAMEQQTISISKANISTVLNARCSVLAAANPLMGSFNPVTSDENQISFQSSIMSRFDCVFRVVDVKDHERDLRIASHIVTLHKQPHGNQQVEEKRAIIPSSVLKKFIAYAKSTCTPIIGPDAMEALAAYFTRIRAEARNIVFSGDVSTNTAHLTVRQLESLVRMTEALAKMELGKVAQLRHAEEAIRLFEKSTMEAAQQKNLTSSLTPAEFGKVRLIESDIRHCVLVGFTQATYRIIQEMKLKGYEKKHIYYAIYGMCRRGELQLRSNRQVVYRII